MKRSILIVVSAVAGTLLIKRRLDERSFVRRFERLTTM